ncbi:MAG: histone H1 [Tepidisphaeraceae bacterium]|jgi:hypothetical protein
MQEFDLLKKMIQEVEDDVAKAEGGNKAAGTRVRKKMQEIKAVATDVRKRILEGRGEPESAGTVPPAAAPTPTPTPPQA